MTSSRASSASLSVSEGPTFKSFQQQAEEWVRIHWGKDDPQTAKEAAQQMPIRQSGSAPNTKRKAVKDRDRSQIPRIDPVAEEGFW